MKTDKKLFINSLKLKFDHQALEDDFSFFALSKSRKRFGYKELNVLDELIEEETGAGLAAALFEYGGDAFLMFDGRKDRYEVQNVLLRLNDKFKAILQLEKVIPQEIPNHYLFQLLLNGSVPRKKANSVAQHLSGGLFLTHFTKPFFQPKKGYLSAVQVNFQDQDILALEVKTFTSLKNGGLFRNKQGMKSTVVNKQIGRMPKYVLDPSTKTMSRCFDEKAYQREHVYVLKKPAMDKGKVNIPYCDLNPLEYPKTKLGLWSQFFWDYFQPKYGGYVEVEQRQMPGWHKNKVFRKSDLPRQLPFERIALVNDADDISAEQTVLKSLKGNFNLDVMSNGIPPAGIPVIHLVREEGFYSFDPEKDPYGKYEAENPVQHLTLESIAKNPEAVVGKCLQELGIKKDLDTGRMRMFDWQEQVNPSGDWYFMAFKKESQGEDPGIFHFMRIRSDGRFSFNSFTRGEPVDEVAREMQFNLFKFLENGGSLSSIDGLIRDDEGNFNLIIDTGLHASFDLDMLHHYLMTGNELTNAVIEKADLSAFINQFLEQDPSGRPLTSLVNLKNWLTEDRRTEIPLKDMSDKLHGKIRGKRMQQFAMAFRDHFGYWLRPIFKNEYMRQYFASMVDIHVAKTGEEVYFWSGYQSKGIKGNFQKTHRIRKLVPASGDARVIFDPVSAMLDVDFVRVEGPTVIPFPFKYLREYRRMREKDELKK